MMKVGDYVRTKNKGIFKIDGCYFNKNFKEFRFKAPCDYGNEWTTTREVIKSSPNIIDLVEVGDYVNGCLIVEISKDPFIKGQINLWTNMIISEGEPFPNEYYKAKILEKDIKSIVTKEQFESMEYKIESEVN